MAKAGTVTIELDANGAKLERALKKATADLNSNTAKMNKNLASMKNGFRMVQVAVVAMAGSMVFNAAIQQVGDMVKAYAEAETAVNKLNAVLDSTGRFSAEVSKQLQESAEAIMAVTTVDDDDLIKATGTLASFAKTLNGPDLKKGQEVIVALSEKLGIDLEKAAMLAGKAIDGNVGVVKRYGIELDKNATAAERMAQLHAQLNDSFDVAKAKTETLTGATTQINNLWHNVQETLGGLIAKNAGFKDTLEHVKNALIGANKFLNEHEKEIGAAISAVFNLTEGTIKLVLAWGDWMLKHDPLIQGFKALIKAIGGGEDTLDSITKIINKMGDAFKWLAEKIEEANKAREEFWKAKGPPGTQEILKRGTVASALPETVGNNGLSFASTMLAPLEEATEATEEFQLAGQVAFSQWDQLITGFGQKFEDTLIQGFKTGKFEFKSLIASMLEDMARLIIRLRVIEPLVKALTGGGGSSGGSGGSGLMGHLLNGIGSLFGGFFADGGFTPGGKPIVVGERGPELFYPGRSGGYIQPNHQLGGGGVTVVQNINVHPGIEGKIRAEIISAAPWLNKEAAKHYSATVNKGGLVAKTTGRR